MLFAAERRDTWLISMFKHNTRTNCTKLRNVEMLGLQEHIGNMLCEMDFEIEQIRVK